MDPGEWSTRRGDGAAPVLAIRYSDGNDPEAEVSATPAEFARLATSINALGASPTAEDFTAIAVRRAPEPYGRCLTAMRVVKSAGPLSVSVVGDSLLISGGPMSLGLLARSLPVESGLPPGYHVHLERAGREEEVSSGSLPLVLIVADGRDT